MRVYIDSSALLKRVLAEPDAEALSLRLATHARDGDALVSSSLAWIEVSRSLRAHFGDRGDAVVNEWCEVALSGILERRIDSDVVALARRLRPPVLRTLDAIHLASALLTDVDLVVAYDARLLDAARYHGLALVSPRG